MYQYDWTASRLRLYVPRIQSKQSHPEREPAVIPPLCICTMPGRVPTAGDAGRRMSSWSSKSPTREYVAVIILAEKSSTRIHWVCGKVGAVSRFVYILEGEPRTSGSHAFRYAQSTAALPETYLPLPTGSWVSISSIDDVSGHLTWPTVKQSPVHRETSDIGPKLR